jgi:hypothetical protein
MCDLQALYRPAATFIYFGARTRALVVSDKTNIVCHSDGIRPEWEDPANGQGGKWVASFARSQKSTLDRTWLYLILAVIGEQFRDSEEICGCVVSIRAQACRIAMWVRSADRNCVHVDWKPDQAHPRSSAEEARVHHTLGRDEEELVQVERHRGDLMSRIQ